MAVFYAGPLSWLNWNLEMLVLRMEKNQRTRIKDLGARREPKTNVKTYSTAAGWILTGHIDVSERSHHCTIPTSQD